MSLEDSLPCSLGTPVFLSLAVRRKIDLTLQSPTAPETGKMKPDPVPLSARPLQDDQGLLKDTWEAVAALPVVAEAGTMLGTW